MNRAQEFLINKKLGDLVLTKHGEPYIYVSDAMTEFSQRSFPCLNLCESKAFEIEIRRLKSSLIKHAAFIARELGDDAITDAQDRRFYKQIQLMKSDAGM